ERYGIDEQQGVRAAHHDIIGLLRAVGVEFILKPGATAALDAQTEHGSERLTAQYLADPPCRTFRDRYVHFVSPVTDLGPATAAGDRPQSRDCNIAQGIVKCAPDQRQSGR